jgi:membrane-associated phospholipid phosphatase
MTYCASLKLFKPMVEFVLVLLAVLCGLSRISDYKHHWSDVFAGLAIGVFIAFFFVLRVLELHRINPAANETQSNDINIQQSDDVERGGTP